jgi:lysophospholipase L1-like esterase
MLAYSTTSTQSFLLSIDNVPTGIGTTAIGKVSAVANSKLWWYKIAGSLDGTAVHDYMINAMIGTGPWVAAVAVAGTFNTTAIPRRGMCWMLGDSIMTSFNNFTEGFGWDVGQRNYNVYNQGVFGALVQTQYQWSPWPITTAMNSPVSPAGYSGHTIPDLIFLNGGYNDAVHDGSTSATPQTDAIHSRTNFRSSLQTYLAMLRTIAPYTKILMLNIPPAGSSGPSLRASYNTDIATVITALADANTILVDISAPSGYQVFNTGVTATANLTSTAVSSVTVNNGGTGGPASSSVVGVTFFGGGGTGATGHAVTNGSGTVTSIVVDTGGSGYTTAPNVAVGDTYDTIHPNVRGYDKIWAIVSPYVPTFSASGSTTNIFGGEF